MEEVKNVDVENIQEPEGKPFIDFQSIFRALVLNWKWFIISIIICLGVAFIYLRYTTPYYQAFAKFLIKED
ncbi:MAG: Wzz/FepE/Etk N-terminal domain-containing protein, partial [Prevotella sp.]|nr:Wzz/FepE/Etk N-terminal domain-containing protein [Prevotella sp.]